MSKSILVLQFLKLIMVGKDIATWDVEGATPLSRLLKRVEIQVKLFSYIMIMIIIIANV